MRRRIHPQRHFIYSDEKFHGIICSHLSAYLLSVTKKHFFASELLENLDEMFPRYYIHSDKFSMFKSITQYCVTRRATTNMWCFSSKVYRSPRDNIKILFTEIDFVTSKINLFNIQLRMYA